MTLNCKEQKIPALHPRRYQYSSTKSRLVQCPIQERRASTASRVQYDPRSLGLLGIPLPAPKVLTSTMCCFLQWRSCTASWCTGTSASYMSLLHTLSNFSLYKFAFIPPSFFLFSLPLSGILSLGDKLTAKTFARFRFFLSFLSRHAWSWDNSGPMRHTFGAGGL